MSQDDFYATQKDRINTVAGDAVYWKMLLRLRDQYQGRNWDRFADWCEYEHGFRPHYDDGGGISGIPEIVDEQKYTLCLLKYSG